MEFIKNLFNLFQEDEDIPQRNEELHPDTTEAQDVNLDDILTSQSDSLSDDLIDDIATEMLQELDSSQLVDYLIEHDDSKVTNDPFILDLDDYKKDINVDGNKHENPVDLDDTFFGNDGKTSYFDKDIANINSDTKVDESKTVLSENKGSIKDNSPSTAICSENTNNNDIIIPDGTTAYVLIEENSTTNSDSNLKNTPEIVDEILNLMSVSESTIINKNIDTVVENLVNNRELSVFKVPLEDVSKIITAKEKDNLSKEKSKAKLQDTKDTFNFATKCDESLEDVKDNAAKTVANVVIENIIKNVCNESKDKELGSNDKPFEVPLGDSIDIEFSNNTIIINETIEVPVKNEPTHDKIGNNSAMATEINEYDTANIKTNEVELKTCVDINYLDMHLNTYWEDLIDEVIGTYTTKDVENEENLSQGDIIPVSFESQEAQAIDNDEIIDLISQSSDSCVIQDSDYCSGYHSSDFEFITESDAENDGFIINVANKKFKPDNENNCEDSPTFEFEIQNTAPIEFNTENIAASSSANSQNERKAANYNIYDPNKDYSYPNHVRYLPNLEYDNNIEHRIPEGNDYLNLFHGVYAPIMTTQMFFMENKCVGAPKSMDVRFNGIGFDLRRMMMVQEDDEECQQEAEEAVDRILEMYPGANRRRRRLRRKQNKRQ